MCQNMNTLREIGPWTLCSPIKICTDPLSLRKWLVLFLFCNTVGRSHISLILVRPAAYFPWVFKCNFMCELDVARLWKTHILTLHRCVHSGEPVCTHARIKSTQAHINTNTYSSIICMLCLKLCNVLFNVCCSMFAYDCFICWGFGGGEELKLADIQSARANLTNSQTNLKPILIGLSSVSITCFAWQTCKQSRRISLHNKTTPPTP